MPLCDSLGTQGIGFIKYYQHPDRCQSLILFSKQSTDSKQSIAPYKISIMFNINRMPTVMSITKNTWIMV
jgi:hypothetical protein